MHLLGIRGSFSQARFRKSGAAPQPAVSPRTADRSLKEGERSQPQL